MEKEPKIYKKLYSSAINYIQDIKEDVKDIDEEIDNIFLTYIKKHDSNYLRELAGKIRTKIYHLNKHKIDDKIEQFKYSYKYILENTKE